MSAAMMIMEDIPDPKEAQLNCMNAFESRDWSTIMLLLVWRWEVDCAAAGWGLDPSPPMSD